MNVESGNVKAAHFLDKGPEAPARHARITSGASNVSTIESLPPLTRLQLRIQLLLLNEPGSTRLKIGPFRYGMQPRQAQFILAQSDYWIRHVSFTSSPSSHPLLSFKRLSGWEISLGKEWADWNSAFGTKYLR